MRTWIRSGLTAGVLALLGALAPAAQAGYPGGDVLAESAGYFTDVGDCGAGCCGARGCGKGILDWLFGGWVPGLPEPEVVFNDANLFPYAGVTAYPGEAGTGLSVISNYAPIQY